MFFEISQHTVFLDTVTGVLAIVAGLVLPQWRAGLIVGAIIALEFAVLNLSLPHFAHRGAIPWSAFGYGGFWAGIVISYGRWLVAFSAAYAVRRLVEYGWRVLQSRRES